MSEHTKKLPPLKVGDHVRIQNQTGPAPRRWDRSGDVIEVRQHDQYAVKVHGSGRATLRNRKFLRKYVPFVPSQPPATLPETNVHFKPIIAPPSLPSSLPTPVSPSAPADMPTVADMPTPTSVHVPQHLPEAVSPANGTSSIAESQPESITPSTSTDSMNNNSNIEMNNKEVSKTPTIALRERPRRAPKIPQHLNDYILK